MYCEDYPCCGHTTEDPCNWRGIDIDNSHAFCDHEIGWCEFDDSDEYVDEDDCEDDSWDDADSLVSIGWGTDEDYGYYGEDY